VKKKVSVTVVLLDHLGALGSLQSESWANWGTLWLFNMAMENGPFMDDFPTKTSIYLRDFPWLC
jgi:hypothetical protein